MGTRELLINAAIVGGSAVGGFLIAWIAVHIVRALLGRFEKAHLKPLTSKWAVPTGIMLAVASASFASTLYPFGEEIQPKLLHLLSLLFILGVTWFAISTVRGAEASILAFYDINVADNLEARRIHTQARVLEKILVVVILVIGLAAALMTFERVRTLGTSMLASAGVVGIIIGFAAQRTIATVVAGLQIALTQPIRLDDVVIVEGEWGRIEEISLTYVVVRIWDLRRLIVPITYFIEKPFQNWTRVSADILGTVYLYVDFTVPVEEIREELRRIVEGTDLWNKEVCGVQVTDIKNETVEVRALVSASDASKAWDLRCLVREKLIDFIQAKYPEALPRVRAEIGPAEKEPFLVQQAKSEQEN